MKKLCVITAARSEYGLLKWLMIDIKNSDCFKLQVIATGGHLLKEQGYTIDQIYKDGFDVDYIVDCQLDSSTKESTAESMGRMAEGFAKAFSKLDPDYIIVLGDRYELLPICSSAFIMRIPIIHISGGDVTEGAIDDGVRNAVTMLSDYHFPGTKDSEKNIIRMRGTNKNIWAVGEPGLDSFNREELMNRMELASNLGLDVNKQWGLLTYHSETKESLEYNLNAIENCIHELMKIDNLQLVATYANADFGGKEINNFLEEQTKIYNNKLFVIPSLGHLRYLSFMKEVKIVIGNSSSGIVEAPFMKIPVINIGNRQKGRYQCKNVFQSDSSLSSISKSISSVFKEKEIKCDDYDYWGDGHTSEHIIEILRRELNDE